MDQSFKITLNHVQGPDHSDLRRWGTGPVMTQQMHRGIGPQQPTYMEHEMEEEATY